MKLPLTGIAPIDDYVKNVHTGKIPACNYVKLAVKRHIRDMNAKDFPYVFNADRALHFFQFCTLLKHYEGEFAGKPLVLEPWQMFVFGSIFGWVDKKSGYRRFRTVTIEIPKKNGKALDVFQSFF